MKQGLVFLASLFLLVSCSSDKDFAPSTLLSTDKDKYVFLFLFEESTSQDEVNKISSSIINIAQDKGLLEEAIVTMDKDKYNMKIEHLPAILIINTEEVVLRTNDPQEAMEFLQEQK